MSTGLCRDDLVEDADLIVEDCVMSSKMTPVKMKRSMCRCGVAMGASSMVSRPGTKVALQPCEMKDLWALQGFRRDEFVSQMLGSLWIDVRSGRCWSCRRRGYMMACLDGHVRSSLSCSCMPPFEMAMQA